MATNQKSLPDSKRFPFLSFGGYFWPQLPRFGQFRDSGLLLYPAAQLGSGEQDCFYDRPSCPWLLPLASSGRLTQTPEPANGFCYHRHWMSLLPLTVSVTQGQELWCQLPPSYLRGIA